MKRSKGFTLIEIVVVIVILGFLAAIAIPVYNNLVQNSAAQAAQNNLQILFTAQKSYYFNNGSYCINTGLNSTCGSNLAYLNFNLKLNIVDNYYNYSCATGSTANSVVCLAVNKTIATAPFCQPPPPAGKNCQSYCTPNCNNASCGQLDGCGNLCINGTSCTQAGFTCQSTGANTAQCALCQKSCANKCDTTVAPDDGCGGECPVCTGSCVTTGQNTQCVIYHCPKINICANNNSGDSVGGQSVCGADCNTEWTCVAGVWQATGTCPVNPNCPGGKICGDDGTGSNTVCGLCPSALTCSPDQTVCSCPAWLICGGSTAPMPSPIGSEICNYSCNWKAKCTTTGWQGDAQWGNKPCGNPTQCASPTSNNPLACGYDSSGNACNNPSGTNTCTSPAVCVSTGLCCTPTCPSVNGIVGQGGQGSDGCGGWCACFGATQCGSTQYILTPVGQSICEQDCKTELTCPNPDLQNYQTAGACENDQAWCNAQSPPHVCGPDDKGGGCLPGCSSANETCNASGQCVSTNGTICTCADGTCHFYDPSGATPAPTWTDACNDTCTAPLCEPPDYCDPTGKICLTPVCSVLCNKCSATPYNDSNGCGTNNCPANCTSPYTISTNPATLGQCCYQGNCQPCCGPPNTLVGNVCT